MISQDLLISPRFVAYFCQDLYQHILTFTFSLECTYIYNDVQTRYVHVHCNTTMYFYMYTIKFENGLVFMLICHFCLTFSSNTRYKQEKADPNQ